MLGTHGHCLTCRTYHKTDIPFIMVISEDPWLSHLLPSVWQWSCHYLFKRLRSVPAGDQTSISHKRGERSTATPPWRSKDNVFSMSSNLTFKHMSEMSSSRTENNGKQRKTNKIAHIFKLPIKKCTTYYWQKNLDVSMQLKRSALNGVNWSVTRTLTVLNHDINVTPPPPFTRGKLRKICLWRWATRGDFGWRTIIQIVNYCECKHTLVRRKYWLPTIMRSTAYLV